MVEWKFSRMDANGDGELEVWVRRLPAIHQDAGQEQGVRRKLQEELRHELRQEDDREGVGKLPGTQRQQ